MNATETPVPELSVTLRRLYALAWPERWVLLAATIFLLISSAGNIAFPPAAGRLLDGALRVPGDGSIDLHQVDRMALVLIIIFAATAVAAALRFVLYQRAGERVVTKLRADLYQAILAQDVAFFDEERTGEIASRLSSDTTILQTTVTANLSMVLRNATMVLGALVMLLLTSTRLTLSMLAIVPPLALAGVAYGKRVRILAKQSQDALAKASEVAVEALGAVRTVKSFAAEATESARYQSALALSLLHAFRRIRYAAAFFGVAFFSAFAAGVFVFWYGARLVASGALTPGGLISFLFFTMQVAFGITALAELWTDVQRAAGAAERIFALLKRVPGIPGGGRTLTRVRGAVRFDGVAFAYPTRSALSVLKDFSLELGQGKVTAIVGPSGAGKSTIASLTYRLYDPIQGVISLDGVDYRSIDPQFLRRQVGVVAQEPILFSTTIRENIRYGRPDASEADVLEAAQSANATEFIRAFPDAFDTAVGERGVQLSGGQKQRIAIARALLKNPRILILDEATSALDSESEYLVREALGRLMVGRTTMVIAHRLSTVRDADRVVVLDAGRVVQDGSHATLVGTEGLYRRLVERQFAS